MPTNQHSLAVMQTNQHSVAVMLTSQHSVTVMQTYYNLLVSPFQMKSSPEKMVGFLDVVDLWLPLCKVPFKLAFDVSVTDSVYWPQFVKAFPSPCGDIHHRSMQFFISVTSQISPDSMNLLMMSCTMKGEMLKNFTIAHWGMLFLTQLHFLLMHFFDKVILDPSLPIKNSAFPGCSFYTQAWLHHLFKMFFS